MIASLLDMRRTLMRRSIRFAAALGFAAAALPVFLMWLSGPTGSAAPDWIYMNILAIGTGQKHEVAAYVALPFAVAIGLIVYLAGSRSLWDFFITALFSTAAAYCAMWVSVQIGPYATIFNSGLAPNDFLSNEKAVLAAIVASLFPGAIGAGITWFGVVCASTNARNLIGGLATMSVGGIIGTGDLLLPGILTHAYGQDVGKFGTDVIMLAWQPAIAAMMAYCLSPR
ncbi:MAG: hypothetical protein ABL904_00500 [Hyphomicrobiaceae bacterium]